MGMGDSGSISASRCICFLSRSKGLKYEDKRGRAKDSWINSNVPRTGIFELCEKGTKIPINSHVIKP